MTQKINKNKQKMKIFVYKIDNFLQKMAKIVYFCPKAPQKPQRRQKNSCNVSLQSENGRANWPGY